MSDVYKVFIGSKLVEVTCESAPNIGDRVEFKGKNYYISRMRTEAFKMYYYLSEFKKKVRR